MSRRDRSSTTNDRNNAQTLGCELSIVTNAELVELTGGLTQGAAQTRWIKKALGIDAPRKVDGHPMLTWEQVNRGSAGGEKRAAIKWKTAA